MRQLRRLAGHLLLAAAAQGGAAPLTLAVLPFVATEGEPPSWLGAAMADLLIEDIAEGERYLVLERSRLTSFMREAELGTSGFADASTASRVGRIAKLDQALFGNYTVTGGMLDVRLTLVDVDSQQVLYTDRKTGPVDNPHLIAADLARGIFRAADIPLSPAQAARFEVRATDSLTATEHFYRGLELSDSGRHGAAFGEFAAASRADPSFRRARLWMARMLEFAGHSQLALTAYDTAADAAARHTSGRDALLFAGLLALQHDPTGAEARLQRAAELVPPSPHNVEAAFQLGRLAEPIEPQRAHAAYQRLERYHERYQRVEARPDTLKASRFFSWTKTLRRHRDARLRMTATYRALLDRGIDAQPPRGVIRVSAALPEFTELHYRDTSPLFEDNSSSDVWKESFYTIVVPPGHVATGIDLRLRGSLAQASSGHSFGMRVFPFPMPQNYYNTWLGVIYGQTRTPTRLTKHIPFYGRHQRSLTLQFSESHSRIFDWGFKLHLQPDDGVDTKPTVAAGNAGEGQLLTRVADDRGRFSGVTKPLSDHWYEARQRLALADGFNAGIHLVHTRGDLYGEQTDLWWTRHRGDTMIDPKGAAERLPCNSLSHDFSPRLVRAEDGSMRLFFISDRRGRGWELWTCALSRESQRWSTATRVSLETLAAPRQKVDSRLAENLLHYGVTQDKKGRWIVVYRAEGRRLAVVASADAETWQLQSVIKGVHRAVNPAIIEDAGGVYRIAHFSASKQLSLWSSNNLAEWRERQLRVNRYGNVGTLAAHPIQLFTFGSELLVLLSDASRGLQYARFDPEGPAPDFDLVRGIGLQPYAATSYDGDAFLLAAHGPAGIDLKRYQKFQDVPVDGNGPGKILYTEESHSSDGDVWRRIYARTRAIQPDVTTVGVDTDGRVWWGIETGAMTLKDGELFAVDVAEGFFHHHVTMIRPCGELTGLASRDASRAVVGVALERGRRFEFVEQSLAGAQGRVSAIECSTDNSLLAATTAGDVLRIGADATEQLRRLIGNTVTALTSAVAGTMIAGTADGRIFRFATDDTTAPAPIALPDGVAGRILAARTDSRGRLWVSVDGHGVLLQDSTPDGHGSGWHKLPFEALPYRRVSELHADPTGGMWMMPGAEERSRGVVWSNGNDVSLFNAPGHTLRAPTGMAVDPSGIVWIGTAFDGLYRLQRNAL